MGSLLHHHQYRLPLSSPPTLSRAPSSSYSRPSLLSFIARAEPQGSPETSEATPADDTPSPAAGGRGGGGGGFGGAARSNGNKKKKNRKVRRSPVVQSPQFLPSKSPRGSAASTSTEELEKQQQNLSVDEKAFLLAWLGLGALIFIEGIALAASGFLPEEWDSFFVKFVYPTFTPTVFVFFGGTIAYGVSKYLQSEKK